MDEIQQLGPNARCESRIPHGIGYNQPTKCEKWSDHRLELNISTETDIPLPEARPQRLKASVEPAASLQREEEVIDHQGRHIVGRLTPLSTRTVQDDEIRAALKENVPGMKVAM